MPSRIHWLQNPGVFVISNVSTVLKDDRPLYLAAEDMEAAKKFRGISEEILWVYRRNSHPGDGLALKQRSLGKRRTYAKIKVLVTPAQIAVQKTVRQTHKDDTPRTAETARVGGTAQCV